MHERYFCHKTVKAAPGGMMEWNNPQLRRRRNAEQDLKKCLERDINLSEPIIAWAIQIATTSNKVLKNCTDATGESEMRRNNDVSSIFIVNGVPISLNVSSQLNICSSRPPSFAGNEQLFVEGIAKRTAKACTLSSKAAETNKNPAPY